MRRLKQMRADPRWQQARLIKKAHNQERTVLFSQLRQEYGFSEYALHHYAARANTAWIADHIDANTAQTLATRAYQAANRVCLGKAKKVRFRSRGRGLDSVEGKSNKQGLRFVLQPAEQGNAGISSGGKIISRSTLTGVIQWSVMDSSIISNSLVFSDAAPQVSGQKEPIARAIATMCSSHSKASLTRNRSIRSAMIR